MKTGIAKKIIWGLYALLALLALIGWHLYRGLPSDYSPETSWKEALSWNPSLSKTADSIQKSIFQYHGANRGDPSKNNSLPYRLAGTFLEYGDPDSNTNRNRKAIIDDLEMKRQALLSEGDEYRNILVQSISKDHIVIERNGSQHELWLSFNNVGDGDDSSKQPVAEQADDESLGSSRFGRRVGENRWVFKKQALRDFYQEMLDDPARAVDIYETMRPDYGDGNSIDGYVVDIVGERKFFESIGLNNGDVVRKVNSMDMTNRSRAEYFIREFMKDRVNAVVLDIERDGKPHKQVYLLR